MTSTSVAHVATDQDPRTAIIHHAIRSMLDHGNPMVGMPDSFSGEDIKHVFRTTDLDWLAEEIKRVADDDGFTDATPYCQAGNHTLTLRISNIGWRASWELYRDDVGFFQLREIFTSR